MLEWVQCHPRAAVLGRASRPVPSHLHATQTAALHSDSSLMELRGERVKGQFRGGFEVESSKSQSQYIVCWITFYYSVIPSIILAFLYCSFYFSLSLLLSFYYSLSLFLLLFRSFCLLFYLSFLLLIFLSLYLLFYMLFLRSFYYSFYHSSSSHSFIL